MFTPSPDNLGGALLIQQAIHGMRAATHTNRDKRPSRYSASQLPSPRKKPPKSKYLNENCDEILPQYIVRKDLRTGTESRISNEMPASFAYSLADRKIGAALQKQRVAQQRRIAAAEREQREFEQQFTLAAAASSSRPGSSAAASRRPQSARQTLSGRPEWNPSTQTFQSTEQVNGIQALLGSCEQAASARGPHHRPAAAAGMSASAASSMRPTSARANHQRHISSQSEEAASAGYRADHLGRFVAAPEREMHAMLSGELARNADRKRSAQQHQQQQPGALIREAARRILQRVDCMGERVSHHYRDSIAANAAYLLPAPLQAHHNQRCDTAQHEEFLRSLQQQQQAQQALLQRNTGAAPATAAAEDDDDGEEVPVPVEEQDSIAVLHHPDGDTHDAPPPSASVQQQTPQLASPPEDRTRSGTATPSRPGTATPPPAMPPAPPPRPTSASAIRPGNSSATRKPGAAAFDYGDEHDDDEKDDADEKILPRGQRRGSAGGDAVVAAGVRRSQLPSTVVTVTAPDDDKPPTSSSSSSMMMMVPSPPPRTESNLGGRRVSVMPPTATPLEEDE